MKTIFFLSVTLLMGFGMFAQWDASNPPVATTTQGNVGIGPVSITDAKLTIQNSYGNTGVKYGINNYNFFSSSGTIYGINNNVVIQPSNTATTEIFGVRSFIQASGNASKYAIWGSTSANQPNSWAGYFRGRGYFSEKLGIGAGGENPASILSIANGASDPTDYGKGIQITNADGRSQQMSFIRMWQNVVSLGYKGSNPIWGFGYGNANDASFSPDFLWFDLATGNVRIGARKPITPHDNAKLSVDGKLIATSIYVNTTTWADYVFANDYQLPKLSDVETFYKENKHLPEIPSEKEVIENGVNVAEMNKLLLKKVEELTLYIVEQNKRIEKLENDMSKK